jgi:transcriptional regulator with XRE-family HTH domain
MENADHKPNPELITFLRLAKGLSMADLAKQAKLGVRTIERIEGGKHARLSTYRRIAQALGVQFLDLCKPSRQKEPGAQSDERADDQEQPPVYIEVRVKRDTAPEKIAKLAEKIQEITGILEGLPVVRIQLGSIRIVLELTKDQADKLTAAVQAGDLAELGVEGAGRVSEAEAHKLPELATPGATPSPSETANAVPEVPKAQPDYSKFGPDQIRASEGPQRFARLRQFVGRWENYVAAVFAAIIVAVVSVLIQVTSSPDMVDSVFMVAIVGIIAIVAMTSVAFRAQIRIARRGGELGSDDDESPPRSAGTRKRTKRKK